MLAYFAPELGILQKTQAIRRANFYPAKSRSIPPSTLTMLTGEFLPPSHCIQPEGSGEAGPARRRQL